MLDKRITGLAGDEREHRGPECEQFGKKPFKLSFDEEPPPNNM